MPHAALRIAAVSLHTSPVAEPGSGDAGGMNVVVHEQARALARAGHQVDLFTRRTDEDTPEVLEVTDSVRLITLEAGPAAPLAKSAMEQAIAPFAERLAPYLREGGYDVVHSHHWFSGVAALPACRELGLPHLQSFHSVAAPDGSGPLDAGEPPESPGRVPGEQHVAASSDLVVAVSEAEAATVAARYGIPADRLRVVRPGVDVERFRPGDACPQRRCAEPMLLFAARLQPLKGPDLALEVLARIDPSLQAQLVLIGGPSADFPDEMEILKARAEELGVRERVRFAGPRSREDLAADMREASMLLLTSWSETFGLVALESQASGTPVAAWAGAGGVREAVGPAGLVLADRDPAAWAHAVEALLADCPTFTAASHASREFALTRTWEASAAALEDVYRRALENRS